MRTLVLLVLVAACEREWVRGYDGILPGTRDGSTVLLVRDGLTGRPVPGAVVRRHLEWHVGRDASWAPAVAEGETDEFGLASLALPEVDCHWAVLARGYAPTEVYGVRIDKEIDLWPPGRFEGRVLGIDGRPLAGARVDWKVGCAHSPSLASARTDAGGLVRFDGVRDGDFVLEDPRGTADYLQGVRRQGFGPGVDQVLPATTIRGRVLTRHGRAPAWAVLTAMARVPRAVADADGRFELRGLEEGHALQVWWEGGRQEFTDDFAPGIEAVLRVGTHAPEPRRVTVRVRVRCADGTPPPDPLAIHFDGLADGRRRTSWLGPDDPDARVPLGVHLVGAGFPWSKHFAPRVRIDLRGRRDVEIALLPQPALELPELPEEAAAHVVLEDRSWQVEAGEPAHLPAGARAWLRVDLGPAAYTFPIGPERDGVRRADVRLPGRKIIRVAGLEGGFNAELMGEDAAIASPEETGASLATYAVGEQWLQLAHPERGWALVKLDLPFEAATIEPECTLTPWPEPVELRVVLDDGTPVAGAYIRILDDAEPLGCLAAPDEPSETDGKGILRRRWLREGLHLRITREDCVWSWATLSGSPPYEVRLGTAAIELDVSGLESPAVVLDGMLWESDEDTIVLSGLSAGPHTLVVGAESRQAAAYGLVLRRGETRRIRPELR